MSPELVEAVARVLARGERAALVTIVRASGSTPQRVGAKMLVLEDGRTVGTIGGGCYENDALGKARLAMAERPAAAGPLRTQRRLRRGERPHLRRSDGRLHRARRPAARPVRRRRRPRRLPPRAPRRRRRASASTSSTTARRSPTASASRTPPRSWSTTSAEWLASRRPAPRQSHVVVVTRGHRHDLDAVRALAARDVAYVGLIGSRAKVARIFDALVEEGVAARRPPARPRPHRPRHRRRDAGGDRRQHRRRADRRPPRTAAIPRRPAGRRRAARDEVDAARGRPP